MDSNLMAETSTVVTPLVATPWATPVRPPFGTDLRDRSAVSPIHPVRPSYVAGGSTNGTAALGSAGNHTASGTAVAKQDRPPRGVPR